MTSNWPLLTVMLKRNRVARTMKKTGKRPNAAPWAAARPANPAGIPQARTAIPSAATRARSDAQCAFILRTARQKKTTARGTAATAADSPGLSPMGE